VALRLAQVLDPAEQTKAVSSSLLRLTKRRILTCTYSTTESSPDSFRAIYLSAGKLLGTMFKTFRCFDVVIARLATVTVEFSKSSRRTSCLIPQKYVTPIARLATDITHTQPFAQKDRLRSLTARAGTSIARLRCTAGLSSRIRRGVQTDNELRSRGN
jgi:hypothetical protein